jgi:hypothetical protein
MIDGRPVTFVVLSCRRTQLLSGILKLFKQRFEDYGRIDRKIIIDDSHDVEHHERLQEFSGEFEIVRKPETEKGHAHSLNLMLDMVGSGYLIYWEDDAVLASSGPWLKLACEVLKNAPSVVQVTFDRDVFNSPGYVFDSELGKKHTPCPHRLYQASEHMTVVETSQFKFYVDEWPGFTLRPHVLDIERFSATGKRRFNTEEPQNFEYEMAVACYREGLVTAGFTECDVYDIGALYSSYQQNGIVRLFEMHGGIYSGHHYIDVMSSCYLRHGVFFFAPQLIRAWSWMVLDQMRQKRQSKKGMAQIVPFLAPV